MLNHSKRSTTCSIRRTDKEVQKGLDPKYQGLYAAINEASSSKNAANPSLWVSVQAELNRYGLGQAETASAVLHAALIRGKRAIDQGRPMPNPSAWLRLTCRYIIKEKKRASQKEPQLEFVDAIAAHSSDDSTVEVSNSNSHPALKKALQSLSQLDQEILTLKVVHELRWEEVQTRLVEMAYPHYSLAALRKHKSRAVLKLRKKLSSVYYPNHEEMF